MSLEDKKIQDVKKIAVLRANALGDYLFATPALAALRAAYPQAEMVLLGKPWHADFLAGRPGPVDRVLVIPPTRGVGEAEDYPDPGPEEQKEVDAFFARAQAEQFDIALQMHGGGGNSNPFIQKIGARITAGQRAPGAPPLDRWMVYFYWQHEVMRLLEVAGLVGAPVVSTAMHVEVTERDRREAHEILPPGAPPLVIIHPGASDPRRRWPAERFASVGDALAQAGSRVAVVGIPAEAEVVARVVSAMRQPVIDLCGRVSLHGLTGLLEQAALVVANDSGPRHLAEAVGTPTASVYWCGNMINAGPAFRECHRPHISWRLECPVCGQNTLHDPCAHTTSFVDDVPVEAVLESALDLLKGRVAQGT